MLHSLHRRAVPVRAALVAGAATAVLLAVAAPASAHVTVSSASAVQGGYSKVTFRVPNEKDNASTTQLEANLPADTPIPSVSLKPVQGWTATTESTKLATPIKTDDGEITEAVTKITWKADATSAIKPGQFQEFDVSLGPLPKTDQLVFKALQTYSDGDVVRWIDVPQSGQLEPEHPAPVLKLTPASGDAPAATGATAAAVSPLERAGLAGVGKSTGGSAAATWLAIAGLIAALAALGVGVLAYRRTGATAVGSSSRQEDARAVDRVR